MAALIIKSDNPENLKLLAGIAKKMGDIAKTISVTDMEDLFLGKMMEEAKTGEQVSIGEVLKSLSSK